MTDGKSVLLDIMKHTIGLGFIQQLKVVGTAESTKLYAIDNDRSTILNGTLHTPHESFIGEFGMGNLKILNSLIKMSTYREESSTIDVLTKDGQPTSLLFKDQYGNSDTYRFMSKEIVEQTMTIGQFKGVPWNIEFQPELTKVNLLGEMANIYTVTTGSESTPSFIARVEDGNLVFDMGSLSTGFEGKRTFAENVEGTLNKAWPYVLVNTLTILRLGLNGTCSMKLSDQGVSMITVDSGIGEYNYILPALTNI